MPTLVDGSVRLTESMAICEYLATRHHSPLLVEPGDPERIEFVQWLWYGESTLMTPLSRMATVGAARRAREPTSTPSWRMRAAMPASA